VKLSSKATAPVTRPVFSAVSQCTALNTLPRLPGMHIMQALVGCQKRSTKSLRRTLHPINGVAGMGEVPAEGHHPKSSYTQLS
jgi:hypothetical protein